MNDKNDASFFKAYLTGELDFGEFRLRFIKLFFQLAAEFFEAETKQIEVECFIVRRTSLLL